MVRCEAEGRRVSSRTGSVAPSLAAVALWPRICAAIGILGALSYQPFAEGAEPPVPPPAAAERNGPAEVTTDLYGDPLPPGAIARLGTLRLRGKFDAVQLIDRGAAAARLDQAGTLEYISLPDGGPRGTPPVSLPRKPGREKWERELSHDAQFLFDVGPPFAPTQVAVRAIFGTDAEQTFALPGNARFAWADVDSEHEHFFVATRKAIYTFKRGGSEPLREFETDWASGFCPRGPLLATADNSGWAVVHNPATGDIVNRISLHKLMLANGPRSRITSLAFSRTGRLLAVAWNDANQPFNIGGESSVVVLDARSGELLKRFDGYKESMAAALFSWDESLLAVCDARGMLGVEYVAAGKPGIRILGYGPLGFSPDNKYLYNGVAAWRLPGLKLVLPGQGLPTGGAAASPVAPVVATSGGGDAWLWDAITGKSLGEILGQPGCGVSQVVFSGDGRQLAATTWGAIAVYDLGTLRPTVEIPLNSKWVALHMSFGLNDRWLVYDDPDTVGAYDLQERRLGWEYEAPNDPRTRIRRTGRALAVHPSRPHVAFSRHGDPDIAIADYVAGKVLTRYKVGGDGCNRLAYSTDGRRLFASLSLPFGTPPRLIAWDTETGREVAQLQLAAGDGASRLIPVPGGSLLIAAYTRTTQQTLQWMPGAEPELREVFHGASVHCLVPSSGLAVVEMDPAHSPFLVVPFNAAGRLGAAPPKAPGKSAEGEPTSSRPQRQE